MIRQDSVSGWDDVDLEHAGLDDFRPLYAICSALSERLAAADGSRFDPARWHTGAEGYLSAPKIRFLRAIAETIHEVAGKFVNLDPAVPYETNHYQDFPIRFSSFDVSNSDHPMAELPAPGSTAATPGALAAYRRFLADARHWLGRLRYVYADVLGVTKSTESETSSVPPGDLAGDFRSEIRQRAAGPSFRNGGAVYRGHREYRKRLTVFYDSHDAGVVTDSETRVWCMASASESSGVWVANPRPIPANLIVFWGYAGEPGGETLLHPGTYGEWTKTGAEVSYRESAEGFWGATGNPVVSTVSSGGVAVRTKWTYSPDGTQSKTETSTLSLPSETGRHVEESDLARAYSKDGWIHAADERTEFGVLRGGESVAVLPEKASLDLPPDPGSVESPAAAFPLSTFNGVRERFVGPIALHAVLDYGPHYKFP